MGLLWEADVANIPGIVFQEPGGSGAGRRKTPDAENTQAPPAAEREVTAVVEGEEPVAEMAEEAAGEAAPIQRRTAARKNQQQTFPVHVVKPHPLAFARAQEIIEANDSYTKILPGDEPGTVIVR